MGAEATQPRKTFRKRIRALWKHSIFNPYHLDRKLLIAGLKAESHAMTGRMLDVGCGDRPYAPIFTNIKRYVGIEHPGAVVNVEDALRVSFVRLNGIVDTFADAKEIPFVNESFDCCLCTEVLEHVPDPSQMLDEIRRVVKPGGKLLLTVPFVGELHQTPYDFWRFTPFGLRSLFTKAGFEIEKIHPRGNFPIVAGTVCSHSIYRMGARQIRRDGSVSLYWWSIPFVFVSCAIVQIISAVLGAFSKDDGFSMGYVILAKRLP